MSSQCGTGEQPIKRSDYPKKARESRRVLEKEYKK